MSHVLLVLDGHNLSYRSHFALAHMASAPDGPKHALLGFVKSMRALEKGFHPTHRAVVFDGGLSAERLKACPEYKAQRPGMPDALRAQMPLIEEYLKTASIPAIRKEGVEADDILATLARRAAEAGASVRIVSSDKDLCQMIGERIRVVAFSRSGEGMDEEGVFRKFGVSPGQLVDCLALMGDVSDHIEGVPGIGGITAAKLLQKFHSVDALYSRLSEVPNGTIRQALAEHRNRVERNRGLVRLITNIEGLPEWESLRVVAPPREALDAFFSRVGLPSLVRPVRQPDLFEGI